MEATSFVYILTTRRNTALYCGVTGDLTARMWEHKKQLEAQSFAARYNITKLVYYEGFETIDEAIRREKEIKGKSRKYKENLIRQMNPEWKELDPKL